ALARSEYEEAISISEGSGDVQGLAPALAGLAPVVAGDAPEGARELAERAVACGTGLFYAAALLAAGWVAAAAGDPRRAGELAATAGAIAESRRDRAALAEALAVA